MFADYHVHTDFSDDSKYPMKKVIEDAIKMRMNQICFTDHVDYGIKCDWNSDYGISYRDGEILANVDYPLYYDTIREFQLIYDSQISIRMGMEFGIQKHTIPQFEKLFRKYPFDFIILSCHQVEDKEFWNQDFQHGKTQREYNQRYYEEILKVIKKYKNYSVLGHLDLINRYDKCGIYPFEKVSDIITEILEQVVSDGKGIEVNTSSYRYGIKDLTPSREILKLYRKLGGTILTIGSDSHEPEHLGAYIKQVMGELEELGFEYFCTYKGMCPQYHKLSVCKDCLK